VSSPGVVMVGVHHRAAEPGAVERAHRAAGGAGLGPVLAAGAAGAVAVVTCHRVELYLEGCPAVRAPELLRAWGGAAAGRLVDAGEVVVLAGEAAGRHLLRVAAGLEAAVLGDDQVLGQVREAYAAACRARAAGPLVHRLFHAAFRAGKRVRSETGLGRGGRSLAGVAAAEIGRRLGGLRGRSVLVLGAGEMASLTARRLARRGVGRIVVSNRTSERARALAARVGGEAVPWSWRVAALSAADAVVVGTAARGPVLAAAELAAAARRRGRLVAVDLSMPRNLERPAGQVPGLEVLDLEALAGCLDGERRRREGEVRRAERIVEEELSAWLAWVSERAAREGGERGRRGLAAG